MTKFNMTFDTAGTGRGFYTEAIELNQIGVLEITRASTIEFNTAKQQWEVKTNEGEVLFENPSRQACLLWEQQHFNAL
jgi:hypothetical protein